LYGLSNLTSSLQAKYICDVKFSGSNDTLVRIKQPANNSGFGVFELSDILHDYTDYDQPWKTTTITNSTNNNVLDFSIEFGQEYASNASASLIVEPSQITSSLTVYPIVTEYTEGYNFPSSSYFDKFLTNSPRTLYTKNGEYGTLSFMNLSNTDIAQYRCIVFDIINGVTTQVAASGLISNSIGTTNTQDKLVHIPLGPKNWSSTNITGSNLEVLDTDNWTFYRVTINPSFAIPGLDDKLVYRLDDCIEQNGTRFAFINKFGVYDYFTAALTRTETQSYNQDTYEQSFIDYSTTNGLIPFNESRRGTTIYNKQTNPTFTAQTDWLTTEEVDWLVELFQSPEVYIQEGEQFLPVVITNTTAQKKTNPRGQKLFTYTIEYKLANPRRARR
jgi:hypothetical protein